MSNGVGREKRKSVFRSRLPDFDKEFRSEADAANYGIGAVNSQKNNKDWRPVAYFSKHSSQNGTVFFYV